MTGDASLPLPALVLWDIDGTLLTSGGAGLRALADAGRELFGDGFRVEGVPVAGRLDPLIWRDLARLHGMADPDPVEARFRSSYAGHLKRRLSSDGLARALPGAHQLVERLADTDAVIQGLLTGNYPETGKLKLAQVNLEVEKFSVCAWGSDGPERRALLPVALGRLAEKTGTRPSADRVLVVGDTPHDIDCARAHGCRSLGVATGTFEVGALREAGADRVVEDLSDADSILEWMLSGVGP